MNILNHEFKGPFDHNKVFQRNFACVYAIVSPTGKLVDVGQTGEVNDRLPNHDRKRCWLNNGCPDKQLYVYLNNNEQYRIKLETAIRSTFVPACGIR